MSLPCLAPAAKIKDRCEELNPLLFYCFPSGLSLTATCAIHKMAPLFQCREVWVYIPSMCMREYHKTLVPYHALVSLSNLWQSLWSQGLKDTRRREKKGSKSWRKINTALWNKKCRLFTFHWSDDAGETPQTGIKLREYIFSVWGIFTSRSREPNRN